MLLRRRRRSPRHRRRSGGSVDFGAPPPLLLLPLLSTAGRRAENGRRRSSSSSDVGGGGSGNSSHRRKSGASSSSSSGHCRRRSQLRRLGPPLRLRCRGLGPSPRLRRDLGSIPRRLRLRLREGQLLLEVLGAAGGVGVGVGSEPRRGGAHGAADASAATADAATCSAAAPGSHHRRRRGVVRVGEPRRGGVPGPLGVQRAPSLRSDLGVLHRELGPEPSDLPRELFRLLGRGGGGGAGASVCGGGEKRGRRGGSCPLLLLLLLIMQHLPWSRGRAKVGELGLDCFFVLFSIKRLERKEVSFFLKEKKMTSKQTREKKLQKIKRLTQPESSPLRWRHCSRCRASGTQMRGDCGGGGTGERCLRRGRSGGSGSGSSRGGTRSLALLLLLLLTRVCCRCRSGTSSSCCRSFARRLFVFVSVERVVEEGSRRC